MCTFTGPNASIAVNETVTIEFNVTAAGAIDVAVMAYSIVPDSDGAGASTMSDNYRQSHI